MPIIKWKGGKTAPRRASPGASGFDLTSAENVEVGPLETVVISTGLYLEIPEGYEGQIRGRSGLAAQGIFVHTGTIDSDYRGEIKVVLTYVVSASSIIFKPNHGLRPRDWLNIEKGARIAQIVITPVTSVVFKGAQSLSRTKRGANGFGSTGR